MTYTFFMYVSAAVVALFIGLGQGLAFNVKGIAFRQGLKLTTGELAFVALVIFLLTRHVSWFMLVDGFIAAGIMISVLLTQNERPPRYLAATRHSSLHIGECHDDRPTHGRYFDFSV
ncbi:MAG: hypothetical protein JWL88_722 [Parcubacteria group bacterium]|nr:hypothetical protein [Parcubacteria group bacterium]